MIEFGKTLREAREARGYSISQVAEMTRMMSAVVDGLEREDFSHIPAPIYGRGFVRLYCEAVGIDARPLVAAFMEMATGAKPEPPVPAAASADELRPPSPTGSVPRVPNHVPAPTPAAPSPAAPAREVPEVPVAEPSAPWVPVRPAPSAGADAVPARTFRTPAGQSQPDLFNQAPERPAFQPPHPVPDATTSDGEDAPGGSHATLSRYSVPLQEKPAFRLPSVTVPPRVWRMGALGLGGLAVLILLGFGLRALYRATTEPADTRPTAEETIEQEAAPAKPVPPTAVPAAPAAVAPQAPREVQKIPPLYFD